MMRNFANVSKELSFLVNSAVNSALIRSLVVEEDEKDFAMRPSLHLIFQAGIGQVKSTVMSQIGAKVGRQVITEISRAGLVGSIDGRTTQLIPGAAWESRNSLLLLDEFTFTRKKEGWEVFLQLLENQTWGKRIGIFSSDQNETDGDLYIRMSKGKLDMKTRFSCIAASMKKFEFHRGQSFRAFVSRCVPYSFSLSEDDLDLIASGKELYARKDMKIDSEMLICHKAYSRIKSSVIRELRKCESVAVRKELFLRSIGDCCRLFAVWGKNDRACIRDLIAWKIDAQMSIGKYYREAGK